MSSSILPRRQNKRRNVEQEFRIAYQTSDEELIKFMHENDENLAVAIEYFSDVLEVRVNHKEISILQEGGILHSFTDAPPKEVLQAAGNCVHRVIAKGCNKKFFHFLKSLQELDYFFCQYKYKNARQCLTHKFTIDEAILDIRTLTLAELKDFGAECTTLCLFQAEDAITKIQILPSDLKFSSVKYFKVHADYAKGKTLDQKLQYLANAIENLPKICPKATYLSITFFMGILSEDTVENLITRVSSLMMNDALNNIRLKVRCQFYKIDAGVDEHWHLYNYRLQAQQIIKISDTKTLDLVRDPLRCPKGELGRAGFLYLEGVEGNEGQLERKWFDEILDDY